MVNSRLRLIQTIITKSRKIRGLEDADEITGFAYDLERYVLFNNPAVINWELVKNAMIDINDLLRRKYNGLK